MRILPSTGAFIGRVNNRDHRAFLGISDRLSASSYEFMMYEAFYGREEEILGDFLSTGLSFPVFHAEKRIGELVGLGGEENLAASYARFRVNCRAAARLGAEKLVLHLWNGPPSDRDFSRHLAAYRTYLAIAREHGLLLTVENVVCACRDPLLRLSELSGAYPEAAFTFDTKMAAFHRQEGELGPMLRSGRVAHLHLNDYGGTPGDFSSLAVLHLGEGHLDIPALAAEILASGYSDTVTLECSCMRPDGSLVPEKMNASLALAKQLLMPKKEGK